MSRKNSTIMNPRRGCQARFLPSATPLQAQQGCELLAISLTSTRSGALPNTAPIWVPVRLDLRTGARLCVTGTRFLPALTAMRRQIESTAQPPLQRPECDTPRRQQRLHTSTGASTTSTTAARDEEGLERPPVSEGDQLRQPRSGRGRQVPTPETALATVEEAQPAAATATATASTPCGARRKTRHGGGRTPVAAMAAGCRGRGRGPQAPRREGGRTRGSSAATSEGGRSKLPRRGISTASRHLRSRHVLGRGALLLPGRRSSRASWPLRNRFCASSGILLKVTKQCPGRRRSSLSATRTTPAAPLCTCRFFGSAVQSHEKACAH